MYDGKADGPWPRSGAFLPYRDARDLGSRPLDALRADWSEAARHVPTHVHGRVDTVIVTLLGKSALARGGLMDGLCCNRRRDQPRACEHRIVGPSQMNVTELRDEYRHGVPPNSVRGASSPALPRLMPVSWALGD